MCFKRWRRLRPRKWQNWELGPLGGFEVCVDVWGCVLGGGGVTAALSSSCSQTMCVFGVDLDDLLENQTQSVHPDVGRCVLRSFFWNLYAHSHKYTPGGSSNTHILLYPLQRWSSCYSQITNTHKSPAASRCFYFLRCHLRDSRETYWSLSRCRTSPALSIGLEWFLHTCILAYAVIWCGKLE